MPIRGPRSDQDGWLYVEQLGAHFGVQRRIYKSNPLWVLQQAVKHVVERVTPENEKDAGAGERFSALMNSTRALLSGSLDANKFEEVCFVYLCA